MHTSTSGSNRRLGFHGRLAPHSLLYPSTNGRSSDTINTSLNLVGFNLPSHTIRNNSHSSGYRSVTPTPVSENTIQPTSEFDGRYSESRRSNNLSPRRNDLTMFTDSYIAPTRSRESINRRVFRSSTLPRSRSYGSTGSHHYESSFSPTRMHRHTSPPPYRSLSPSRYHNRTDISTHFGNIGSPITRTTNISRDYRGNENTPSRTAVSTYSFNRSSPNAGYTIHFTDRTDPRSAFFESRTHFDDRVPEPLNYYTYSDDEKEECDLKPTYDSPNAETSNVKVNDIDCHVTENARDHYTDRFAKTGEKYLIVRRAQSFRISIFLNSRFSKSEHDVCLEFTTGPAPQPGKGTYVKLSSASLIPFTDAWRMNIESVLDNKVTLNIETAPTAIVGEWNMRASVALKDRQDGSRQMKKEVPFYLLFNPWSRDDDVYFPDKSKLSEYIMNDSGCIFTGGYDQITAKPWFYGQFESGILEASIYCMKKAFSKQPRRSMGDPVRMSRAISKIVNSNDDNGVVLGSWSGNYRDGTAPLAWVGSVSILRKFMKTGRPVKYGQCFVFAGVVTTICRALGIPCRTVTNFSSAHDTDGSVTVDVHWDISKNSEISSVNTDSIWNFHVWNDVWMKRKDLPAGNDGWQVLDSTPQETSDGEFRCGPAPLSAILNGKCDVIYDTAFIYAEVNADRVHWGKQNDGSWQVIGSDKSVVGKQISTKKADGFPLPENFDDCDKFRDDITHQYKYMEGSERERMSVLTATHSAPGGYGRIYTNDNDLKIKILPPKAVFIGSGFDVVVEISNSAGVMKTLSGKMFCEVTKYTGAVVQTCKEETFNLEIEAYQQQKIVMHISVDDYVDTVAEAAMFRLGMISQVKESGQQFAALETFRLRLPDLTVKVSDKFLRAGAPVVVTISFTNPLQTRSLSNCIIVAECPGMKDMKVYTTRNVLPGEAFQTTIQVTPLTRGTCPLFVTFNCEQIHDIKGNCTLFIQ